MARQMKDSGIEWIGEIPEGWVCCKQKHAIGLINGRAYKDDEFLPEAKYRVLRVGNLFTNSTWYYSDMELEADKYCENGDLIYAWSASYGPYIWDGEKVIYHYHIWKTVLADFIDKKYAYYYLLSLGDSISSESHGSAMQHITMERMNNSYIAYPDLSEQYRIADFLDRQCAEIDAVIERTKATIEEYKKLKQAVITEAVTKGVRGARKMKDSGIEWIGEIPEEWRVIRGKNLFVETNERSTTGEEELLTVSHITGITPRSQKNVNMFMSESLVDYKICRVNDIAANTMWMWQGAIGVSKHHGVISPSYNVYRQTSDAYDPDYLDYLLRIRPLVDAYNAHSTGITASRLRLYPEQFLSFFFFVPNREEQGEIVEHLNRMCGEMDNLITEKTALLTELETYKKSLIYEYVTGKKECPEAVAQAAAAVVYPYFPAAVNTKKLRFAQAMMMAKILDVHGKGMGRVKLEKMLYTIETSIGFDFDTEYVREAAGPLHESIYKCEGIISRQNHWYQLNQSQYGVSYMPTKDAGKYRAYYDKYFSAYNAEIERIIGIFKPYNTDQAEVVATLFAAWNDAIIEGKSFTDEDIVDDVLNNWHDNKKRFPRDMWLRAMDEMRKNNLIPNGYGKKTVRRAAE